ncbi:MAG TPA: phage holin family protein [Jatrophihabitans sp.]|nr:phage holin family protein [Jatrophihabitans sp.]
MISRSVRRRIQISLALTLAWRPTGAALINLIRSLVTSFIALGITLYLLPGTQSSGPAAVAELAVLVGVVGSLLRPVLLGLTVLLGSFGLLVVGMIAQGVILAVAIRISPDVHISGLEAILGASWIAAIISAAVNWLLDAGSQDAYLAHILGRVVRVAHRQARTDPSVVGRPGMLIVQLDGVGRELLRQAMVAGAVPTLSRWLRAGSHVGYGWHTGLPATTPAGQAVLLYGDRHHVPAFRWYEKDTGRLMVANRSGDAAELERRMSDGRGLLADGGVSVSNLFSGDAATQILTMSDARLPPRSTRGVASFATTSVGFVRTVVVFAGQVVEELYQARRQRRRDVQPRVSRGWLFALLRGVTTALLHDLNVAIVAEQMARGAPVIFVDFVDYDEVAHHAGPSRPEAMRTLDGLDRVLRFFEDVAAETNRRYELVVVSDHGQSQGSPFADRAGRTLQQLVDACCGAAAVDEPTLDREPVERWTGANLLLTSAAHAQKPGASRLARRAASRVGPERPAGQRTPLVAASGSLAHIYLTELPGRADRSAIEHRWPGLIEALAAHPWIGLVLLRSGSGLLALGAEGWRDLHHPEAGAGRDPLLPYGPRAAADLIDLDAREHVGDLIVLGSYDPETAELAAFEELVGSHGGLGGDQTAAFLLVPQSWPELAGGGRRYPSDPGVRPVLSGAEVHQALLARLTAAGLRADGAVAGEVAVRA